MSPARPASSPGSREELNRYLVRLEPIVGGSEETLHTGLTDLLEDVRRSRNRDDLLHTVLSAWQTALTMLRSDLVALRPPADLDDAHGELIRSLDGYILMTERLTAALRVSGQERSERADEAAAISAAANDAWLHGLHLIRDHAR